MRTSVIIAMVMLLKAYLKTRYALSEEWANWVMFATCILIPHHLSKCSKFVVGKKSAIGDKPATKRNDTSISWDRLPFATTPLLTTNDADEQKIRVRVLCRCLAFVLTSCLSSWKSGMKMAWQLNPTMTSYKSHPHLPLNKLLLFHFALLLDCTITHSCLSSYTPAKLLVTCNNDNVRCLPFIH